MIRIDFFSINTKSIKCTSLFFNSIAISCNFNNKLDLREGTFQMVKKTRKLLLFGLIILFQLSFFNLISATAHSQRTNNYFGLFMIDAGYADLDGDMKEDDIYITSYLHYYGITDESKGIIYDYYLVIIKPDSSRLTFTGSFSDYTRDFYLIFHVLNSVDQSGWYLAYLEIFNQYSTSFGCIIFDPPILGGADPV